MATPRVSSWKLVNKIGRYLLGRPRLVMRFRWQSPNETVTAFTDSDWAGCAKTSRSTSGGIICIGEHVIKTYSRQQRVVALSSAEAELYAMVAASAEALAVVAYAKDLGASMAGEVYVDSSAALGISQRCGIGKVRHLRTQGLWVQEARLTGRLAYKKVLGTKNPADVLTKHVPAELLQRHLETLCTEVRGGRAETAPELNSLESFIVELKIEKEVRFNAKVQVRPISAENNGRRCKGAFQKKTEGKWGGHRADAGGASPSPPMAVPNPRPRWADLCEEEEQADRRAKGSSGDSENTVDYVVAETASKFRTKFRSSTRGDPPRGSHMYRDCQHNFANALSQIRFDSMRRLTSKVPSSGQQSVCTSRLSKGELWDLGVSEGSRGLALRNVSTAPSGCYVRAGHGWMSGSSH